MISVIFNEWTGTGHLVGGHGIADDLRCCAHQAQEAGLPRAAYMAEAISRGFNKGTAATCWAYVRRQEQ